MTDDEINELERLINEYNAVHGEGTGEEISGSLMFPLCVSGQIKVFKRARGREILLEPDPDALDTLVISYL